MSYAIQLQAEADGSGNVFLTAHSSAWAFGRDKEPVMRRRTRVQHVSGARKAAGSSLEVLLALALAAAGCDRRAAATANVERVGTAALRAAAASLSSYWAGAAMGEVPRTAWPEAIREFAPDKVLVDRGGVYLEVWSRFVAAAGVYVVFEGAAVPEEGSGDPSFRRISDRIHWYEIKG
jgi:hypothetical protein